jgi:hypothetical protein
LSFGNFLTYHDYEPELLLVRETWTGWKAKARLCPYPTDPDIKRLKNGLVRAAFISGPKEILLLRQAVEKLQMGDIRTALEVVDEGGMLAHYRIWGAPGKNLGIENLENSFRRMSENPSILSDLLEILEWAQSETTAGDQLAELPFPSPLELHAQYGIRDIQAVFRRATLETAGQTGVGVLHFPAVRVYADYPISRELLHWESQSNTTQESETGQNLIHPTDRGYTILVFARDRKKKNGCTAPFTYLGNAERVSFESERPIKVIWRLRHPMPVEMLENNRRGG